MERASPCYLLSPQFSLTSSQCSSKATEHASSVARNEASASLLGPGRWMEVWMSLSPNNAAGSVMLSSACLHDQVLLLLTEGEGAVRSFALANWRLWLEGWPLPSHPHGSPCHQLSLMPSQTDRLAILAATWRIWCALVGAGHGSWPALPMDAEAFRHFQSTIRETWPHLDSRLPFVLVPEV